MDRLIKTLLNMYHDGNVTAMSERVGINRTTLSNYLHRSRKYNIQFVIRLRKIYGIAKRSDGISDTAFFKLMEYSK